MRSPEVMNQARAMGDYLRYRSSIGTVLSELAILVTAREWTQDYEWYVHYPIALEAGVRKEIADAIADARRPEGMSEDEAIVYDFSLELHRNKRVSDATYGRAVKRFGVITTKTAGRGFAQRAAVAMAQDPAYAAYATPMLEVLRGVVEQIRTYDRQLRVIAREHAVGRRLMTVPGVGHLTALAFLSTIEDPSRFKRSADVGPYLGLTPKIYQSGEIDRSGRITKTGDAMTRSYLVEAANVLLVKVDRPVPLRLWGLRIMERAGLKKAQVAVARKLAVLMHAMWSDGTEFEWAQADA